MWALSEETLRAEATRVFTETGGSAAAIKLSIIQLDSQSDEELGGKKMQANSDGSPFGKRYQFKRSIRQAKTRWLC